MKLTTRIIAVIMLIALLVSAFAIFSAFAEDAVTVELQPEVILDMDEDYVTKDTTGKQTISVKNTRTGDNGKKSPSITKKTDDNDDVYWLIESNALKGTTIGKGGDSYFGSTSASTYWKPTADAVIADYTKSDGTVVKKDTDFLVIDVDISTDTQFIPFYFNMRYYDASGTTSQTGGYGGPMVAGCSYDELYVSNSKGGYARSAVELPENEWVNITFVYDFRNAPTTATLAYAYINGYYVGTINANAKTASKYWPWLRLSFNATATHDYQTTKLRNLTYTKFPVGWEGDLTDGRLGAFGITLDNIEELSYCLEGSNSPRFTDDSLVATIDRTVDGELQSIPVKNVYDLDGNIYEGDVVNLHQNIDIPLVVKGDSTKVTFNATDENGVTYNYSVVDLSEETTKITDWSTVGYVALNARTRAYLSHGTLDEFATKAKPSSTPTIFILFGDAYYHATAADIAATTTIYDLNGNTMIVDATNRQYNTGANGLVRWQDGKVIYRNSSQDVCNTQSNCVFVYQNIELLELDTVPNASKSNVFFDHRNGLILFKDIDKLDVKAEHLEAILQFSSTDNNVGVVFDGVNYDDSVPAIYSANRDASAKQFIVVKNSSFNIQNNSFISNYLRAHGGVFKINVFIDENTEITTDYNILSFSFNSKYGVGDKSKVYADVRINDSTLNAKRLNYVNNSADKDGVDYLFDAQIAVTGNTVVNIDTVYSGAAASNTSVNTSISLSESVTVSNVVPLDNGTCVASLTIPAESDIAAYATLPERTESTLYTYGWDIVGNTYSTKATPNFNFKANLTLFTDIYLNAFVPVVDRELFDADNLTVKKGSDPLTLNEEYVVDEFTDKDGNEYFKVQIKNITPDQAAVEYTIVANFDDGAKVGKSISVLDYLERGYSDANTTEADKAFLATIYTYIATVSPANAVSTVIPVGTPVGGEYVKPEVTAGINVSLLLGGDFAWVINDIAEDVTEINVTYTDNGEIKTRNIAVVNGTASINLRACDLLNDVTVVVGDVTANLSFSAYAALAIEADAGCEAAIDAIYDYASAASNAKALAAAN